MVEQIVLVIAGALIAIGVQGLVWGIRELIRNNPKPRYRRNGGI